MMIWGIDEWMVDQPKRSPISISSSSAGGGGGGAGLAASLGLSAFFSATGSAAGAAPPTFPKNSVTLFPLRALATALTRLEATETPAALRTALRESALI